MIIPEKQLKREINSTSKTLIHIPTNVQLFVKTDGSNLVQVLELDSIGNTKSIKEFPNALENNFKGFFEAIKYFEEMVAKKMGGEEKFGFEAGMVWTLSQDLGKYKAGDTFLILEASPDGTRIIQKTLLQPNEIDYLKSVGTEIKDNSSELDILKGKGITNLQSIDENTTYQLGENPNTVLKLPNTGIYGENKYQVGSKVILKNTSDSGEINEILFVTDANGGSVISAIVETETETLTVPLKDLKPKTNKDIETNSTPVQQRTSAPARGGQSNTSSGQSSTDLSDVLKQAQAEYKKMLKKVKNNKADSVTSMVESTDKTVWDDAYDVGDLIKVRPDLVATSLSEANDVSVVVKKEYISSAVRPENPSGILYSVFSITRNPPRLDNWEGKDIYLAFEEA
jgi:hypothetical protein